MTDRIGVMLADAGTDFVLFIGNWCPYCDRAKRMLDAHSLSWTDYNIDDEDWLRGEVVAMTGHRTVPVIFDMRGDGHVFVGGSDDLQRYL